MTISEELKNFFKSISHWVYYFLGFFVFFFSFGLKEVLVFGKYYFLPVLSQNSFSVQVFKKIQYDFLPPDVHLVVTNPTSAFVSQILLSLLLAFITTFPLFLYNIMWYLFPALLKHEKKLVFKLLLPSIFLFFLGCVFAYLVLIPTTFEILYPYAFLIGAIPFFSVNEFISSVLGLMIVAGLMFLLPVFMFSLTFMGLVKSSFWRDKWRHAFLFFLVLSAIITPDGTGITMMILFIPFSLLYLAGCALTNRLDKNKINIDYESN